MKLTHHRIANARAPRKDLGAWGFQTWAAFLVAVGIGLFDVLATPNTYGAKMAQFFNFGIDYATRKWERM